MIHIFISSIFVFSSITTTSPDANATQEVEDEEDDLEDEDMFYLEPDETEYE